METADIVSNMRVMSARVLASPLAHHVHALQRGLQ